MATETTQESSRGDFIQNYSDFEMRMKAMINWDDEQWEDCLEGEKTMYKVVNADRIFLSMAVIPNFCMIKLGIKFCLNTRFYRFSPAFLSFPNLSQYSTKILYKRCYCSGTSSTDEKPFVIETSKEEWKYVQRLIPPVYVPTPKHDHYPTPSGWIAPAETPPDLPYFIQRNRHHELPIFLEETFNKWRKITLIKNVLGDVWALDKDWREHIFALRGMKMGTQVNEYRQTLRVKGDFVLDVKKFIEDKGF